MFTVDVKQQRNATVLLATARVKITVLMILTVSKTRTLELANNKDSDETAHHELSHQDLHGFSSSL